MTLSNTVINPRIRSFSRRESRMTSSQRNALLSLWSIYGLKCGPQFDKVSTFLRDAPIILEIGFGNGESLADMADLHPERDYLGVEVHRPGVGHLMLELKRRELTNVRIYCDDAVDVLNQSIRHSSLDGANLFFPDPWPKKRHHKRRLVTAEFIALLSIKLKPGAYIYIATDWEHYAQQIISVLKNSCYLKEATLSDSIYDHLFDRPITKFEKRGCDLGHKVWNYVFVRIGANA